MSKKNNTPIFKKPLTEEDLQYLLNNPATKELFNEIQESLSKACGVPSDKMDSLKEGFIKYI